MPITPEQLAGKSEHSQQAAFFCWCGQQVNNGFHQYEWIHSIPNGGKRNKVTAAMLKKEGQRKGVVDVFMPYPIMPLFAGLYIEFKKPDLKNRAVKNGGLSDEQVEFARVMKLRGYSVKIAYDWLQAANHTIEYISHEHASR